jgi:hypothetical protein
MLEVLIHQAITLPAMVRQYEDQQFNLVNLGKSSEPFKADLSTLEEFNPGRSLNHFLDQVKGHGAPLRSPQMTPRLRKTSDRTLAFAKISATPRLDRPAIPAPVGWRSVNIEPGVTAYNPPIGEEVTVEPSLDNNDSARMAKWDGTRHPYIVEVSMDELLSQACCSPDTTKVAPHLFIWSDTWQGEGYDREHNGLGQLVSQRESGADIHVGISFDASVTNPNQPNLRIILINDQDTTSQDTNLSAFLLDQSTGKAIDRQDFKQLPPAYEVTLTLNGGFKGTEVKTLEPLETLVFEYHVTPKDLRSLFPIRLEGINRLFNQRQQEVETLESLGWVVMEVPPPS